MKKTITLILTSLLFYQFFLIMQLKNMKLLIIFTIIILFFVLYFLYFNRITLQSNKILKQIIIKSPNIVLFKIDYKKNKIFFIKNKLNGFKEMTLSDFAINILNITYNSPEMIALHIGKLDFETYKKTNDITIKCLKTKRNKLIGFLQI